MMILILSCIYVYYKKWIISTDKWFYIIVTHVMTFTWNYESEFSIWMLLHYTRNGDTKYQASCTMVVYLYHCWLYIFINNDNLIINFLNGHEFNYTKKAGAPFTVHLGDNKVQVQVHDFWDGNGLQCYIC